VIVAITIDYPRVARVIGRAASIRQIAVHRSGALRRGSDARIVLRHMLPERDGAVSDPVTAFLGQAILSDAAVSFLGLGVNEPTPAWGLMLRGASVQFVQQAPWLAIAPGVGLSWRSVAFNLLGDSAAGSPRSTPAALTVTAAPTIWRVLRPLWYLPRRR